VAKPQQALGHTNEIWTRPIHSRTGKDGHPFSAPLGVYDETLDVLKGVVSRVKLGRSAALVALSQLDLQARAIAGQPSGPSFDALLSNEQQLSPIYGGRPWVSSSSPQRFVRHCRRVGVLRQGLASCRHSQSPC
jgi:hypothetical protein